MTLAPPCFISRPSNFHFQSTGATPSLQYAHGNTFLTDPSTNPAQSFVYLQQAGPSLHLPGNTSFDFGPAVSQSIILPSSFNGGMLSSLMGANSGVNVLNLSGVQVIQLANHQAHLVPSSQSQSASPSSVPSNPQSAPVSTSTLVSPTSEAVSSQSTPAPPIEKLTVRAESPGDESDGETEEKELAASGSNSIVSADRWQCPYGCGRMYSKSSTRSVKRHKTECPLRAQALAQLQKGERTLNLENMDLEHAVAGLRMHLRVRPKRSVKLEDGSDSDPEQEQEEVRKQRLREVEQPRAAPAPVEVAPHSTTMTTSASSSDPSTVAAAAAVLGVDASTLSPNTALRILSMGLRGVRKRRKAHELLDNERWNCPHGCGKFFRKTSTLSIHKHKLQCPLRVSTGAASPTLKPLKKLKRRSATTRKRRRLNPKGNNSDARSQTMAVHHDDYDEDDEDTEEESSTAEQSELSLRTTLPSYSVDASSTLLSQLASSSPSPSPSGLARSLSSTQSSCMASLSQSAPSSSLSHTAASLLGLQEAALEGSPSAWSSGRPMVHGSRNNSNSNLLASGMPTTYDWAFQSPVMTSAILTSSNSSDLLKPRSLPSPSRQFGSPSPSPLLGRSPLTSSSFSHSVTPSITMPFNHSVYIPKSPSVFFKILADSDRRAASPATFVDTSSSFR